MRCGPGFFPARRSGVVGLLMVLVLALAGTVAPPAGAAAGTLSGTVALPGGAPSTAFTVEIYRRAADGSWGFHTSRYYSDWFNPSWVPGTYSMDLAAGTYAVCIDTHGAAAYECWEGAIRHGSADPVVLPDGGAASVHVQLDRVGAVQGRVVGPGATPVPGAPVRAYYLDETAARWVLVHDSSSGADGRYRIPGMTPGTYRVCAEPADRELAGECWLNSPSAGAAQDVVVAAGRTTGGISFGLARRASISGSLTDAAGAPVPAQAYAFRFDTTAGRWVMVASASGPAYRIGGLDPGTYRVCFDGAEYLDACWRTASEVAQADDVAVTAGRAVTGIDAHLTRGGVIAGTLHDVYTGAQGEVQLDVYRLGAGGWQVFDGTSLTPYSTTIPYEIPGLPSGTYRVCAWHSDPEFVPGFAPECHGGTPTAGSADDVVVVQGQTTGGIDLDLDPLSAIRGRVTGADRPVPVQLYTATGRLVAERTTDAVGAYAFRDLPNGSYRLAFHRKVATTRWAAEFFRNRAEQTGLATSTTVSLVDQTNATGISGVLEPGGSITGRIVDGTGAGVAGCRLRAQSPTGALVDRLARSGASGSFDIGGLSTGPYLLRVDAGTCAPATTTLFYDAAAANALTPSKAAADPVAVTRGTASVVPRVLGSTTP